ncbi:MAG: hypothetical protein ACOC9N_03020 [Gemmatimonadota bacterium]
MSTTGREAEGARERTRRAGGGPDLAGSGAEAADAIARAVLYEGHILWPYRRSALKNRQRWTFGGVYPETWSARGHPDDPSRMRTQCLVRAGPGARVDVHVRFLHIVERQAARVEDDGADLTFVDRLDVAGERHLSWTEATEREVVATGLELGTLATDDGFRRRFLIDSGRETEWLTDGSGERVGALVRRWRALRGTLSVRAEPLPDRLFRLSVEVENDSPWRATVPSARAADDRPSSPALRSDGRRADAQRSSFVSLHAVLRVEDGEFVSLMDPPARLAVAAAACDNRGWWPVLVGDDGARDTMLASPIILYDHPRLAPESPGDLFDSAEIDQLLILNVLSLTAEEKREMRASDPRAREILDRCGDLSPEQLMRLHGAIRSLRPAKER